MIAKHHIPCAFFYDLFAKNGIRGVFCQYWTWPCMIDFSSWGTTLSVWSWCRRHFSLHFFLCSLCKWSKPWVEQKWVSVCTDFLFSAVNRMRLLGVCLALLLYTFTFFLVPCVWFVSFLLLFSFFPTTRTLGCVLKLFFWWKYFSAKVSIYDVCCPLWERQPRCLVSLYWIFSGFSGPTWQGSVGRTSDWQRASCMFLRFGY